MIVIELNDEKFGKAMHNISCIEDKLAEVKRLFEEEASSGNFRRHMPRRYDDMDFRDEDREYRDYPIEFRGRQYGKKYM